MRARGRRAARSLAALLACGSVTACINITATEPSAGPPYSVSATTTLDVASTVITPDISSFQPPGLGTTAVPASIATTDTPCVDGPPCYTPPSNIGTIPSDASPEASGVAASSTDPDLFFVVDDASRTSQIVAIHANGAVAALISVDGMSAGNAEAIVNGQCDPGSPAQCLFVGDIGADPSRAEVTVYRIPEPDATTLPASVPADAWTYRYPDGAYNAEAMLVDDDGSVLLITKPEAGRDPHRLYRGAAGGGALELVNTFTPPVPTHPVQSLLVGNVVTDASRSPGRVLLLTYDQAVEYVAPTPAADPASFTDWPFRQLTIPRQWQSEGISYLSAAGLDACGYLVVSEQSVAGEAETGIARCG